MNKNDNNTSNLSTRGGLVFGALTLVLIGSLAPIEPVQANSFWFIHRPDPFHLLNDYLVANEPSEDAQANVKLINELVDEHPETIKDKSHLEALRSFTLLMNIDETNLCDDETHRILSKVTSIMSKYTKNPLEDHRIQERPARIVIEYLRKQAQQCSGHPDYVEWGHKRIQLQLDLPNHELYTVVFGIDQGFNKLNDLLTSRVKSEAPLDNLLWTEHARAEYKSYGVQPDSLMAAMDHFIALRQLTETKRCSIENSKLAYDFMAEFKNWVPNPFGGPKAPKRLVQIVQTLMNKRGADCMLEYAEKWHDRRARDFDANMKARFDAFADLLIDASDCKFNEKFRDQRIEDLNCIVQRSDVVLDLNRRQLKPVSAAELKSILAILHLEDSAPLTKRTLPKRLNEALLKPCKALTGNKITEPLAKSFYTAHSVQVRDSFFRLAAGFINSKMESIHDLIEWTTIYGFCKRLMDTDQDKLLENLALVGTSADDLDTLDQ